MSSGSQDTWNVGANWEGGAPPSGAQAAVVARGVTAIVDSDATLPYSGGLSLEEGATLSIGFQTVRTGNSNALGTGPILMEEGSQIILRAGSAPYELDQGITLEGDATIASEFSTGVQNTSHVRLGKVSGPGTLLLSGGDSISFSFMVANPEWSGGLRTVDARNEPHTVIAYAGASLGTGDVTINSHCGLMIFGSTDAIGDDAKLTLSGPSHGTYEPKVILEDSVRSRSRASVARTASKHVNA